MEMALVRMDKKGRVLIPRRLREAMELKKDEPLFAYTFESLIFLRKVKKSEIMRGLKV